MITIALGCDKAAAALTQFVKDYFDKIGVKYTHLAADDETAAHYPNVAKAVAQSVSKGEASVGILICGTGIGMSMAANKINGIRAAVANDIFSAKFTKLHNDANVLCLGARVIGPELALEIIDTFLKTKFEGERHALRVDMISKLENL